MAVEDYLEPEVAAAAAVTAVIASPKVRQLLRRGAVLGLAGILAAGDAVGTLVKSAGRGAKQAATDLSEQTHTVAAESPPAEANEQHANGKPGAHRAKHTAHETVVADNEEQPGEKEK